MDEDVMRAAGIVLDIDERGNLVYEGAAVEFVNLTIPFRIDWVAQAIGPAVFRFYTRFMPDVNPSWSAWLISHKPVWINGEYYDPNEAITAKVTNQTILTGWNQDHNWTRITQKEIGFEMFITCEKYGHDIIAAIDAGDLNITIGQALNQDGQMDASGFIRFYSGLVSGENLYDLPEPVAWFFRLEALLFMFSLVVIARDLIPVV